MDLPTLIRILILCLFLMKLNMIRTENELENLLLSITKNYETLIEQTHRKPDETLEFKMNKSKKHFNSNHQFKLKKIGC